MSGLIWSSLIDDMVMTGVAAIGRTQADPCRAFNHTSSACGSGARLWCVVGAALATSAVARLSALGFAHEQAAEAYLACDRNEMLAANFLMDSA